MSTAALKARESGTHRAFRAAFVEALDGTGRLLVVRAGAAAVRAVEIRNVRTEFERQLATGEADTRKRADAQRKAFIRALGKLAGEGGDYRTCVQEDREWIW
jgi:hypothetical protein